MIFIMLSVIEKIIIISLLLLSLFFAFKIISRIIKIVRRGRGFPEWDLNGGWLLKTGAQIITLKPTFNLRIVTSIFHALIAWCFIYYLALLWHCFLTKAVRDFSLVYYH